MVVLTSATKVKDHVAALKRKAVFNQELPDYDTVLERAEVSLREKDDQLTCPYLLEFLPNRLSLDLVQVSSGSSQWLLENPVHALHLTSQIKGTEDFKSAMRFMPCLYGEEQERLQTVQMRGFSETTHPLSKDWTALHEHERTKEKAQQFAAERAKQGTTTLEKKDSAAAAVATDSKVVVKLVPSCAGEDAPSTVVSPPARQTITASQPVEMKPTQDSTVPKADLGAGTKKPEAVGSPAVSMPKTDPSATTGSITGVGHIGTGAKLTLKTDPGKTPPYTPPSDKLAMAVNESDTKNVLGRSFPPRLLREERYWALQSQENNISQVRKSYLTRRGMVPFAGPKKKKKSDSSSGGSSLLNPWREYSRTNHSLTKEEYSLYQARQERARCLTQLWVDQFRAHRTAFWQKKQSPRKQAFGSLPIEHGHVNAENGDDYIQCLECSFRVPIDAENELMVHHVKTNHTLGVTLGRKARIFCLPSLDFVEHEVFEAERERVDLTFKLPWLAWKEHQIQRSFDAYRFKYIPDQGIFWKGMYATYPSLVRSELVRGARACLRRQELFHGETEVLAGGMHPLVHSFALEQKRLGKQLGCSIHRPVGMYNLGNTCYQSAVLQCLIACDPFQRFFLEHLRHPFSTADDIRKIDKEPITSKDPDICLASSMDRLFLQYFGSSRGINVLSLLENKFDSTEQIQGDPIIASEMLLNTWKYPGMSHLAGYDQRDAHEFFHGFLDGLAECNLDFRLRVRKAIQLGVDPERSKMHPGVVNTLFEGNFRSVLICQECGNKRSQTQKFMSISLPLSKEVQRAATASGVPGAVARKLAVELCLLSFTTPEMLIDPVDCPSCKKKTATKQQHVISRLPRVLCLHLKRFDAAQNKKIEDFVAFPEEGLNMGQYLPHWCEVPIVAATSLQSSGKELKSDIPYRLFGTVNHHGNMQSGHYIANVKMGKHWYHINDQHVGLSSSKRVLESEGAYLLFYIRT